MDTDKVLHLICCKLHKIESLEEEAMFFEDKDASSQHTLEIIRHKRLAIQILWEQNLKLLKETSEPRLGLEQVCERQAQILLSLDFQENAAFSKQVRTRKIGQIRHEVLLEAHSELHSMLQVNGK
jgi:hypothetical protein